MNTIIDTISIWTTAQKLKTSGRGRSASNQSLHGINKLRELILELAVRGKLVPQDPNDEPASILLKKIVKEKARLLKEGKIKKQKPFPEIKKSELPFELPIEWIWVRWDSIALKIGDIDHKMPEQVIDGYAYVSPRDFYPNNRIDLEGAKKISKEDFFRLAEKIQPQKGDIIYPRYGTIGENRLVETEVDFLASYSCCVIKTLHGFIDPNYQFLYSISMLTKKQAKKAENKTTQANVGIISIQNYFLPLPPLAEQRRIVSKVDELMTLCDQLEQQQTDSNSAHEILVETLLDTMTNASDQAELETAWQRISNHFETLFTTEHSIDRLKQTILQLAVMGKLTRTDLTGFGNLSGLDEPASVLLKRIAKEKARLVKEGEIRKQKQLPEIKENEKPFELPNSWVWVRVWDVAKMITSGSRDWAKYFANTGAKFITMGNLSRGSYKLRLENIRYVKPPKDGEGSRTKLEANDLLLSITGDVGNLGLIPDKFGEAYINQHTCLLRFMPNCQSKYFPTLMLSPLAIFQFNAPQRGIKNSFRLGDIGEMVIPLPPLAEQHRIVAKVDELFAICDALKERINESQVTQLNLADALVDGAVG